MGDPALRCWIVAQDGDALSPRQLRFWELMLDLPSERVDVWVKACDGSVWANRTA
jgi:hypothetical protein